jgi:Na+-driven multidrug efflux pump
MIEIIRNEAKEFQLHSLAFYSIFVNSFDALFYMADIIMLGHLGKGNLAAGAVAFCF